MDATILLALIFLVSVVGGIVGLRKALEGVANEIHELRELLSRLGQKKTKQTQAFYDELEVLSQKFCPEEERQALRSHKKRVRAESRGSAAGGKSRDFRLPPREDEADEDENNEL